MLKTQLLGIEEKISEMERRACFKKEVIHLYFVILATQRSLMTASTVLEECRARSQIEVGSRSGKGGSRDY